MARDGVKGLFKGFLPNVVKNMPNKTIQLTAFDIFKGKIAESGAALAEEKDILAAEDKAAKKGKGRGKK